MNKAIKSIKKLTSIKFLGSALAIIYSVLQAKYFGTGKNIEVYFGAISIVAVLFSLSQSGVLAEILLPKYLEAKEKYDVTTAHKIFSIVINRVFCFVLLVCIVAYLIAPLIIEFVLSGFDVAAKIQCTTMFRIICFLLIPQVVSSFMTTVLNAEEIYGKTELIGVSKNVINLTTLIITFKTFGIWSLVVSLFLGHTLAFFAYFYLLNKHGIKYYLIWKTKKFDHKSFFRTIKSTLFYAVSTQVYSLVLNSSLSFLPQGYYAIFKYVETLYTKTRSIITQPMITVFFTDFSKMVNKEISASKKMISEYVTFSFIICSFVILLSFVLGKNIINVLWGSEKFNHNLIAPAATLLTFNYIALLITSFGNIFRKIIISKEKANVAYLGWGIGQLMTALITWLLLDTYTIEGMKWVFILNVSILSFISWLITYVSVHRLAKITISFDIIKTLILLLMLVPIGLHLNNFLSSYLNIEENRIHMFYSTILISTVLTIAFLISANLFRVEIIHSIFKSSTLKKNNSI